MKTYKRIGVVMILALVLLLGLPAQAAPLAQGGSIVINEIHADPDPSSLGDANGDGVRQVTVMTRNLYFGADLTPVITAPDGAAFIAALTQVYVEALASDFAGRAEAIAAEIAATEPHLVGLQEAAIWRTGPLADPAPATQVEADFVQLILGNLDGKYEILAAQTGFDAESPIVAGVDVRLTIQDVLLVRTGLTTTDLELSNVQTGNYVTQLTVNSPIGPIAFPRQWIAVDVKIGGKDFRVIATHLESVAEPIRLAQAQELLNGPASTSLPTILIGDINAQPSDAGDAAATLLTAGFTDVWPLVRPTDSGFTCCQAGDLRNDVSMADQRIDLILIRNGPETVDAQLAGDNPINLVPSGVRWASDHAGVVATMQIRSFEALFLPAVIR